MILEIVPSTVTYMQIFVRNMSGFFLAKDMFFSAHNLAFAGDEHKADYPNFPSNKTL